MNDVLGCIFNPVSCVSGLATGAGDAIVSLFPFGVIGVAFTAGLIIGAILGKWGVGALIALGIAIKFGSSVQVADSPAQPTSRVLTRDEVATLQRALKAYGIPSGPIDGKAGRMTRDAIRKYQTMIGESPTGIPTAAQLKALGVWK